MVIRLRKIVGANLNIYHAGVLCQEGWKEVDHLRKFGSLKDTAMLLIEISFQK